MNVCLYDCRVLSGTALCVGLSTAPEESYRMRVCVDVCVGVSVWVCVGVCV